MLIGLLAGFVCFNATMFIKRVLKIDDSLDVFPVHGVGGMLGTLMAGILSPTSLGVFSGYGFADGNETMGEQLYVQFVGVAATVVFTAVVTYVILKLVGAWLACGFRKRTKPRVWTSRSTRSVGTTISDPAERWAKEGGGRLGRPFFAPQKTKKQPPGLLF